MSGVEQVDVNTVARWQASGDAVIIDVREDHEYAAGHVNGSYHMPMSAFDPSAIPTVREGQRLVFMCAAGQRSQTVAHHVLSHNMVDRAYNAVGGMNAWQAAGLPIEI